MSYAALSPDWQVTALFLLAVLPLFLAMKCVAFWGTAKSQKDWAVILSPFPTPGSAKRALPLSAAPRVIRRFLLASIVCISAYWLYWSFLAYCLPPILLSYVGAIMLWLVSEALGAAVVFFAIPATVIGHSVPHGQRTPGRIGNLDPVPSFEPRRSAQDSGQWSREHAGDVSISCARMILKTRARTKLNAVRAQLSMM